LENYAQTLLYYASITDKNLLLYTQYNA